MNPDPTPVRRYLWWSLVGSALWLAVVAFGVPWPGVLLMLPCLLTVVFVAVRGPFSRRPVPVVLRFAAFGLPLVVVGAMNPRYDRYGLNQGQPGVISTAEFWSHVARAEIVALVVIEVALLALARRHPD